MKLIRFTPGAFGFLKSLQWQLPAAVLLCASGYTFGQAGSVPVDSMGKPEAGRLVFCGGVENEMPVGISDRFVMDTSGNAYIYVFYSQPSPLTMKQIMVEITYAGGGKVGAAEAFSVRPKWKYTFLKCRFPSQGDYRVSVKDINGKTLAAGAVTIL